MSMKLGKEGEKLIKHFEGLRLTAYKCPSGVWTIGWGHTAGVKQGQTITEQQAQQMFENDMKVYERYVNYYVKHTLTQNQFDALVSFTYNCGPGNLQKLIRNRNLQQIADALPLFNKGAGKVLAGLVRRRKMERELFLKGAQLQTGKKYQITATALNVRAGIGTSYKIVRVLKKNMIVDVLDTSNGWGKISDGWISLKYAKEC